jgi:hypothetical protein
MHRTAAALLTLAVLAIAAPAARAAWPNSPTANLPVCTAAGSQSSQQGVSDGAGGTIIAWQDLRNGSNYDIYAQHVLASGTVDPLWPANGLAICAAAGSQYYPTLVSDGAGGAIITWQDLRSGTNYDIYAQHVLAGGSVAWTADGVAVSTAGFDQASQQLVSDGAGGAIITWSDLRSGTNNDIYAQRVLAAGSTAWTANGVVICVAANNQVSPQLVSDGAGGAIITWHDSRSGTSNDIYAQRVLAPGTVAWTANGLAICTAANNQTYPQLVSDGAGGAIITWQDVRSGAYSDIYAQHVIAAGVPAWTADGVAVCAAANSQYSPQLVSDGAGGAIFAWYDLRSSSSYDIYAQRVLAAGAIAWTADGVAICAAANSQYTPQLVSDGTGGAIVTWYDYRSGTTYDVYAQRVLAAGTTTWTADGVAVCTAMFDQAYAQPVSDGAGGAIINWQDARTGISYDIYAQRIEKFGYLGSPEPAIASVQDVMNDQGGKVKVSWTGSYLDALNDYNLNYYYVLRSVPTPLAAQRAARGARVRTLAGDGTEPTAGDLIAVPSNAATLYWEFITTVAPLHFVSNYSYIASTTADSVAGSNPQTAFMIVAANYGGSMSWSSAPAFGYSVDNRGPVTPAPFTGQYHAGATALHWNPNTEPDLAGYRVYRGATASFAADAAHLVAAVPDTGYADASGAPAYYKLTAVDVHGNESPVATLLPAGTTGVDDGAAPATLAFALATANPARGAVTLRLALPAAAHVRVTLYDAAGRAVRTLADGQTTAGTRTLAWDLRDDAGRGVHAGLYFARLVTAGEVRTQRIAVTR